jgi:hypothetical protein
MSTDMKGIYQKNLFESLASITVDVPTNSRYRVLSENLPWVNLAGIANEYRAKKVDINNGAMLDLRLHLGAYIAKGMNGWTDRETEEMVRYHAGVRILCGIACSTKTIDHTSIETFRSTLGQEGAEAINQEIVRSAQKQGFTGTKICSADTTVQEVPISYPTEVGHLKKIGEALLGIGKKIRKGVAEKAEDIVSKAKDIFTEIRLFTRGKKEEAKEKKKKLGKKMHKEISKLYKLITDQLSQMGEKSSDQYQEQIDLFGTMLEQIKQWMNTGFHPKGKIVSLWHQTARAITRDKAAKAVEFGIRWFVTRLEGGYVIGKQCKKIGADSDSKILEEVIPNFVDILGGVPEMVVYDRGGDGSKNHELIEELGIKHNCIFRKGKEQMEVGPTIFKRAKRERALSEASIAVLKTQKYGFNKPRAKSEEGCTIMGHMAFIGANINKMMKDIGKSQGLGFEMG